MALNLDLFVTIVSFLLTLIVLFYLIGDNPAFRVVVYLFVGVSAGYAAAVTFGQVLMPRLVIPIIQGNFNDRAIALVSLIMGVLLLMKLSPRTAMLGTPVLATLAGIGAAVAVGGGTLFPQVQASTSVFSSSGILGGFIMLVGTVTTLVYFHYGAKSTPGGPKRSRLVVILGWVGQIFIAVTLGALFAGVFTASLTALIDRLNFIFGTLRQFIH